MRKKMRKKKKLDSDDENKWYVIKVLKYMAKGKDGYTCLVVPKDEKKNGDQTFGHEETKTAPSVSTVSVKKIEGSSKESQKTILHVVYEAFKSLRTT